MSRRKIRRREFLASCAAAAAFMRAGAAKGARQEQETLLAAAKADDPADAVRAAIDALGGIGRFVSPGQSVMLLPNPQGRLTGASTRPELVSAVARLCLDAGAAKVEVCSIHGDFRWRGTGIDDAAREAGAGMWKPSGGPDWRTLRPQSPLRQNELRVIAPAVEADVLIDMPIAKHHGSTRFTGALKNLMGVNSGNSGWHQGTEYLVESIVDLASVVRPDICVVDATEMLAENGPFGPGRTVKPGQVIAGVDPVAVDAYACRLTGLEPREVSTIRLAAENGIGTMDIEETGTGGSVTGFRRAGA